MPALQPTYSNVMSTLALFVALGGSSYAAVTISGRDVVDAIEEHENLKKAALAAPENVKGGQEQVAAVVVSLGGACKACHDEYRAK